MTLTGCGGDSGGVDARESMGGGPDPSTSTTGGNDARDGFGGTAAGVKATGGKTMLTVGGVSGTAGIIDVAGASHSGGSSNQAGGTTSQAGASTCGAPSCCVPIVLDPTRLDVYQVGDNQLIVNLVIEVLNQNDIDSIWAPYAEVTTSWGGTQSCTAERRYGKGTHYVGLRCPAAVSSAPLACGSLTSIMVRLRTETYADTTPFGPSCVGSGEGPSAIVLAPIECPTCPPSTTFFGHQACDYPDALPANGVAQCSYFLPCTCVVDETTGARAWSCPQP